MAINGLYHNGQITSAYGFKADLSELTSDEND